MRAQFARGEEILDDDLNSSEAFGESFIADFLATEANALVDSLQVRRGIEPRSKASVAKDGFEERRSRTLAVGAGDVGAGIGAIGVAEALGEHGDVFKIELCGSGLPRRGQFAAEGKQVADRVLVIHLSSGANRGSWR